MGRETLGLKRSEQQRTTKNLRFGQPTDCGTFFEPLESAVLVAEKGKEIRETSGNGGQLAKLLITSNGVVERASRLAPNRGMHEPESEAAPRTG